MTRNEIESEARAAKDLSEPGVKNIVSVMKFGDLPESVYYFIDMELCDLDLDRYIARKWPPGLQSSVPYFKNVDILEPVDAIARIAEIMLDICSAVAYIHDRQYVHRDLKPQNGTF